jgi:hypothetical protein
MLRISVRQLILVSLFLFVPVFLLFAIKLISDNYNLIPSILAIGGGKTSSQNYNITYGVLGQGIFGTAGSVSYKNETGYIPQLEAVANPPAIDLKEVYVYPNPFKPNSPSSRFYSDKITFKRLPVSAKIKVFTITGELVATIEKTDPTVDYYEWDCRNNSGEKLASGVYIYFITTPEGEKAKGKFAIVK